jgi:hypothetical protein
VWLLFIRLLHVSIFLFVFQPSHNGSRKEENEREGRAKREWTAKKAYFSFSYKIYPVAIV